MIDRLRTLSPLLRYPAFVAAALLMFFVAVGVGATAALVVGWHFERIGTVDTGGTSSLEAGQSEKTTASRTPEGTTVESPGGSKNDTTPEASFVHLAKEENSRGDYTYISDPSMDGDPDAVVLASPTPDGKSEGGASYDHNIGVWYEGGKQRWAIFNQDLAPVPAGSTFRVVVPQPSARFVHSASLLNTAGNYTYLDNRLTNGEPAADLSVTQNWNPGGGRGVYNNHPIEVVYDANLKQWAIVNGDGASMRKGAAFNVAVTPPRSK
jgi:hypothetical protein